MKKLIPILLLFVACTRQEKKSVTLTPVKTSSANLVALSGGMFQKLKDSLDLSHTSYIIGKQDVKIYMAKFKSNPNRIYAVSSRGSEIFYTGMMRNPENGEMAVFKSGEAVLISVSHGFATIKSLDENNWNYYFTKRHGGADGEFCQREPGESFSACYSAEKDEFCDSFISCLAADTQPFVVIAIAAACSCVIDGPL